MALTPAGSQGPAGEGAIMGKRDNLPPSSDGVLFAEWM
jgi:hypothetical protein